MAKNKIFEKEYKEERLRRTKVRKAKRLEKKGSSYTCPLCHQDRGYVIEKLLDPYQHDMYDIEVYVRMCEDCQKDKAGDV